MKHTNIWATASLALLLLAMASSGLAGHTGSLKWALAGAGFMLVSWACMAEAAMCILREPAGRLK